MLPRCVIAITRLPAIAVSFLDVRLIVALAFYDAGDADGILLPLHIRPILMPVLLTDR